MNITKHALERMAERGCQVDEKIWAVVLDSDLYTVITVRRAHRDEEALWTSR